MFVNATQPLSTTVLQNLERMVNSKIKSASQALAQPQLIKDFRVASATESLEKETIFGELLDRARLRYLHTPCSGSGVYRHNMIHLQLALGKRKSRSGRDSPTKAPGIGTEFTNTQRSMDLAMKTPGQICEWRRHQARLGFASGTSKK